MKQANYAPPTLPNTNGVPTWYDQVQAKINQNNEAKAAPAGSAVIGGAAGEFAGNVNTDLTQRGTDFAHAITDVPQRAQDFTKETGSAGLGTVLAGAEGGLRAAGAAAGGLMDFANETVKAIPGVSSLLDNIGKNFQAQTAANPNGWGAKLVKTLNDFTEAHPEIAKDLGAGMNIGGAILGAKGVEEAGAKLPDAVQGVKEGAANVTKIGRGLSSGSPGDLATKEAISNIANQEGGIVAPAKTASQISEDAQQKTWDVIKPKITSGDMSDAAASGRIVRTGETGVVTQVPTKSDLADIKLARPYVEAADGDPIKAVANMKQGIADEAAKLRDAVGTKGGTFSASNVKGAVNDVKVPLAIKDSAEMTQVNNIKNYVTELAKGVDKNPTGALDLSQKFRQGINSEFGENVWGKGTPISNYIKGVNKALNDFISTRLPDGKLPDGTLIKDSFAKQSSLYDIMDNIQLPKLGEAAINPVEEGPLKVPGSPLSEATKAFGKEHPIIKGIGKAAGRVAGIGAGVHLVP